MKVSLYIVHISLYSWRKSSIDSPYWLLNRGALFKRELGMAVGPKLRLPTIGGRLPEWKEPSWDWIEAAADRRGDKGVRGRGTGIWLWYEGREWGDEDLREGETNSILLTDESEWLCMGIDADCWLGTEVARDEASGSDDVNDGRLDEGWLGTLDDAGWLETCSEDDELGSARGSLVTWPDWSLGCKLLDIRRSQGR